MSLHTPDLLRKLIELSVKGPNPGPFVLAQREPDMAEVPDQIDTPEGTWAVCQPKTELALRRFLWKANGARVLALVEPALGAKLPPDVKRRARGERVMSPAPGEYLALALGVPVVPPEDVTLQRLALRYAQRIQAEMNAATLPTVVDRRLLDELLCDAVLGSKLRAAEASTLLAEWIRQRPSWTADEDAVVFAKKMLEHYQGLDGKLLAWALDVPSRLGDLVVHGALLEIDEEAPRAAWGPFLDLAKKLDAREDLIRKRLVELSIQALEQLGPEAEPLLRDAENRGRRDFAPKMLARSSLLPLGLDNRLEAVAKRLSELEEVPAEELEALRSHRAAPRRENELAILEEVARLVRFVRAEREATAAGRPESLAQHVRSYQASGAFADLCAARLRRHLAASHAFAAQAHKVRAAWRQVRDAQNEAFAKLLQAGYLAALKADGMVPLHRAWTDFALKAQRPLYVVVLDGCSYPVFLELVEALSTESRAGLKTLQLQVDGGTEAAAGHPALAPLPTITSHARSAFFLGQIPKDPLLAETVWREEKERTSDPGRFNQNAALEGRSRKLFLKRDLADGGLALASALRDPSLHVVAVVFNAVDDQIGSSNTGAFLDVKPSNIAGFLPALQAAFDSGREVLVTADHGHTPFLSLDDRVGEGSTPRFRELGSDEAAPRGFVEIDLQGTGGTPGRKAFAWQMGAYQGSPQAGFHGGCSLEEMVVPLAWLVRDGVPADQPAWWWAGARGPAAERIAKPKKTKVVEPVLTPPPPQVELFAPPASGAQTGQLGLPEAVIHLLDATERAALEVLAENSPVRLNELAKKVGRQPARFAGLLTRLNRKLHDQQAARFKMDQLPDGETLVTWISPESRR